jgi:long-subunit fatty acid transport protein
MQRIVAAAGAVVLWAGAAGAGGIDRSGQGLGNLFEAGRQFELSFGYISPSVSGTDLLGGPTGDVADSYSQIALSYRQDINDRLSFAVILDQPFGADILYAPTSPLLGGTSAFAETVALTGVLRYRFDGGFSVHGGLRAQQASGEITLSGLAYGALNGYNVVLSNDLGFGYLVGVAYEKPEIALRVALTYNSAIKHEFDTTQTVLPPATVPTEVETPQSLNLDFQTGIARDTLLFGQIRWADWSSFLIDPEFFPGNGLVELDDTVTWTLGVGRRFSENWSGSVSFQYEREGDPLVSPLSPSTGRFGVTLAGVYTRDNMKITTGLNYTTVGDAQPETGTPDTPRANFTGNSSVGIGVRVAYSF